MIDTNSLRYKLAVIESILSYNIRPTFLSVTTEPDENEEDFIHIVIAHNQFEGMTMQERIHYIFELIDREDPSIITSYTLIVEAFTNDQFTELLDVL